MEAKIENFHSEYLGKWRLQQTKKYTKKIPFSQVSKDREFLIGMCI